MGAKINHDESNKSEKYSVKVVEENWSWMKI